MHIVSGSCLSKLYQHCLILLFSLPISNNISNGMFYINHTFAESNTRIIIILLRCINENISILYQIFYFSDRFSYRLEGKYFLVLKKPQLE